jgi:hypothetical protein
MTIRDKALAKKIAKCMVLLGENPRHPGLGSHRFESFDAIYGERIWESYIENNTPSAWRIWWFFGPEAGEITVVDIGAHP